MGWGPIQGEQAAQTRSALSVSHGGFAESVLLFGDS